MPTPSPGRFRQADAILDAAIDLEPAEREAFVDRACEGNPSLRTLVRRLLRAFEQSGQFLSGPAVELAGPLLERPLDGLEDPADPVPPPERVGPYRVTRELGRGGMGVVYLAAREDDPAAPVVALKTLRGGALAVGTVLRRFLAERRILATLEHPYVAPLLESGITADGVPYFAMAHCEGGSLAERLDHGALPEPEAVRVALQLCEALAAAHGHGIVHRDIKPANVLFNAVGEVQLTDFGIAKLVDQDSTQSGAMMGTPAYLAPEQIRGETVDHRADLWAVGVSIYQMLTGRRPFDGPSYATILNQILTQDPETLTGRASVPPALAALVHHLLQKAPDARPHSADDVVAALAMIAGDPGASYVPAPARPRELPAAAASGVAGTSIVVMPFRNLSGSQDDAPFTDGLTEELITALGKVRGLRVTARATAFALGARQLDVRAVANLIGVAYLLEGSVRRGGDRLKVTAQLVQTDRGEVVWSETYNRPVGEIFAVEEELGGAIVAALEPALGPSAMSREPPRLRDVATYETYLKGRYFWQKRVTPDLVRAAEYFAQAAAADPTYAEAYAGIADAHMVLVMLCGKDPKAHLPKAREAVAEALRLGSGVPLVHATNGHLLSGFDWRWEEAEAELRRAIELNPGIIDARVYLSTMLQHLGRFEEAIAVAHEGLARDPLSPALNTTLGRAWLHAGQADQALRHLESAVEMAPGFTIAQQQLGHVLLDLGRTGEAIEAFRRAAASGSLLERGHLAYALAVSGDRAAAETMVGELLEAGRTEYLPPFGVAHAYAGLGDHDAALTWLGRAVDERAAQVCVLNVTPSLASLRGDPRFQELLVRMNLGATHASEAVLAPGTVVDSPPAVPEGTAPAPSTRRGWVTVLALAGLAIATGLAAWWWAGSPERSPLLAVGTILERGEVSDDSAKAGPAVRGLLVTQLARLSGVEVLSQSRMQEVLARTGGSVGVPAEALSAAHLAGARELLEGELWSIPEGGYTLDLRRMDVRSGTERDRASLRAPDLETLVSQATSWVAQAHGTVPPPASTGELTSRSLVAQRRYESGLEAYYRGATSEAMRYYLAALEEDSTFLAPLYQLPLVWSGPGWEGMVARMGRAAQAAGGAPELERLRMRFRWAEVTFDPSLLAVADSLATRYPSEPEAQVALATALFWSGDFLGAIPYFRRAIAADSALARYPTAATVPCQSCFAWAYLVSTYSLADSGVASLREARIWRATHPGDRVRPRIAMAAILEGLGRRAEMLAILDDSAESPEFLAEWQSLELKSAIRSGDFTEVSRLFERWRGSPDSGMLMSSQGWEVIAERTKGRPRAALAAARQACDRTRAVGPSTGAEDLCALARLSPLRELGNPNQAIRELQERLQESLPDSLRAPGLEARRRAWLLLQLGVALAAAGDTSALAVVADSLERTGRRSGYGRDRRMHHHLRGLLLQARGQHGQAAAEFRQAIWSPSQGYTRTNLELARELLTVSQPGEAVAALMPVLRGPLTGMGTYTTQTEVRALLAEALDRAGNRSGALAQLQWVESAWADAEPPVRARLDSLRGVLRVSTGNP